LSACQTGLDRYYNGEGAIGLARAFLKAGIPLVVASQWPVDSDATADLMVSMYRHRKSGVSTAEALQDAQVEMLHGPNEANRPPRYWAAFVCVGANAVY
jgi:CHAT domain-containing protein